MINLPWVDDAANHRILDANGVRVAEDVWDAQERALIVAAVNERDRLRKALESLAKILEAVQGDLKWIVLTHNLPEPTLGALGEVIATICDPELARAALAEGE